jgi:hypothetical protein
MIYAKELPPVAKEMLGEDVYNRIATKTGVPSGRSHQLYDAVISYMKNTAAFLTVTRVLRIFAEKAVHTTIIYGKRGHNDRISKGTVSKSRRISRL